MTKTIGHSAVDIEKVLEDEFCIDVSGLGLRIYYYHPESIAHYVSYPVENLMVDTSYDKRRGNSTTFPETIKNSFTGNYVTLMPEEATKLFTRYGLNGFEGEYFIGVFREADTEAKSIHLEYLEEWDQEETGEVYKFIGTKNPTKPFEYSTKP